MFFSTKQKVTLTFDFGSMMYSTSTGMFIVLFCLDPDWAVVGIVTGSCNGFTNGQLFFQVKPIPVTSYKSNEFKHA
jgi:hypothetical protein